jgi:hypothetical protein
MVVVAEFGTTLRSLPFVILSRWTEQPDAAENAVYNSSLLALREILISLGSLRMGFPALTLVFCLHVFAIVPPRALEQTGARWCNIPLGSTLSVMFPAMMILIQVKRGSTLE